MKAIPKRRNGYYYLKEVNNKPLVSVTTILQVINKPALIYWAAKRMFEVLAENPDKLGDMKLAISEAIYKPKTEAGDAGSKAHEVIDHEERGMIYARRSLNDKIVKYIEARDKFIADHPQLGVIFSESIGYNETYGYAGQIDRIAKDINTGEVWLIDWKTSNGIYGETGLQMSAYQNFEKIENRKTGDYVDMPKVARLVAVQLKDDGTYQTVDFSNENFNNFLSAMTLYSWWKGGEK